MNDIPGLRILSSFLSRVNAAGATLFGGKRDFYQALGYNSDVSWQQTRTRYERGDIAGRIVDAFPKATWSESGDILAEVIEDDSQDVITPFEQDMAAFKAQVHLWNVFLRADILAGIGKYAVILIGGPGLLHEELPRGRPGDIAYLNCYGEGSIRFAEYEENENDARFGWPTVYELVNLSGSSGRKTSTRRVHWTRVIHVADNTLDNLMEGNSRLLRVWNRLDDLEKIVGGGSEAFWKTVFQGMQIDVDKEMDLTPEGKAELQNQIDEFEHNLRRVFRTRGVKVNTLGADTTDFGNNADTLLDLISGATEIPKRILLGSERGELASTQDRENWHDRVSNRRTQYAAPMLVHPLVDRLVARGYVRPPRNDYWVKWPPLGLSLTETSTIAERASRINTNMGETVVTGPDIRTRILGWDPLQVDDLERDPALETADPLLARQEAERQREREREEAQAAQPQVVAEVEE